VSDDDEARAEELRSRLAGLGIWLEPVGNGVSRVGWTPDLQEQGLETASGAVREGVRIALEQLKQARVEAHVDPEDAAAIRVATWAGMQREGIMRGAVDVQGVRRDRVVLARLQDDAPIHQSHGFRALLNSFLPRKRAIAQLLVRDLDGRVLLCNLTYKQDWDLPGGVVEVNEAPHVAVAREVEEELGLTLDPGRLMLTDWLPPWSGWDDAVCLVFDGGTHDGSLADRIVPQAREIRSARFCPPDEVRARCADFTARRIEAALANLDTGGPAYTESGRPVLT
jgi:8-oxo-dGTP pyrophosphatase MutT (NUDIX family)